MFQRDLAKLQKLILKIPRGKITTYGNLGKAMGKARGTRYIGFLLKSNPEPDKYPCYKVVKSGGQVGGYSGEKGVAEKIRRLRRDGVIVKKGRIVNFYSKLFAFGLSGPVF